MWKEMLDKSNLLWSSESELLTTKICTDSVFGLISCTEAANFWHNFASLHQKIRILEYLYKHCQRHNGPMDWDHNWRYLIASKFTQQVAPHAFVGNSATCIVILLGISLLASSVIINFVFSSIRFKSARSSSLVIN